MTSFDRIFVDSCDELAPGDAIEAFRRGTLVHRGPVMDSIPGHGLFLILDTVTGDRRLLDMSELTIVRIPAHYREVRVAAARP
jgi:hypothetical protein